ncbi:kinase-like domain-containing protein, partial [Russula earlei]
PFQVSPWMENGNIREYVGRNQNADRMRLLSEVASGMEFLHEKGIVHGDLCGKSILINDEGKAFVSGFDLSESLDVRGSAHLAYLYPNSRVRWLAPEMIAPEGVAPTTEDTDIWSFGLLCLEVFTGEDPYLPYSDLLVPVLLKNGMTPQHPGPMAVDLNPEMWALMESCWRMNPAERPGMSTIQSDDT